MLLAVDYNDNRVHIDETHSNHDIIMLPAARWLNCFTRFNKRGSGHRGEPGKAREGKRQGRET